MATLDRIPRENTEGCPVEDKYNCRETTVPLPNLALFVIKKFQEVP